jgi:hypothetical protein
MLHDVTPRDGTECWSFDAFLADDTIFENKSHY